LVGYLGVPYRIVYEGKARRAGLTNVVCIVVRPDLTFSAVLPMSEFVQMGFGGLYYADFLTNANGIEGEYIATIASPTEGVIATHRISLVARPVFNVVFPVNQNELTAEIQDPGELVGVVEAQG
jgi:hypothetical protein